MSASGAPALAAPRSRAGSVTSRRYRSVVKPWHEEAVADLAGDLGHQLADAGEEDLGVAVRVGPRVEERRHQRVRVEVALEVELRAVVPRRPDRPDGEDHLPHARRRVRPRHREPLGDVRLDLAAEAEDEAALASSLEVPGDLARFIGLRANATAIPVPSSTRSVVLCREQEREERVVARLRRPQPVVALRLLRRSRLAHAAQISTDAPVDLHAADPDRRLDRRSSVWFSPGRGGIARSSAASSSPLVADSGWWWRARRPAARAARASRGAPGSDRSARRCGSGSPRPARRGRRGQVAARRCGWLPLQEGERRRRVGHGGDVVRHLGPEPEGREAAQRGPALDHPLHAGGHLDRVAQEALGEVVRRRGRGQERRPGVGDRRGVGAEARSTRRVPRSRARSTTCSEKASHAWSGSLPRSSSTSLPARRRGSTTARSPPR